MSVNDHWFHYNDEYDILICVPCGVMMMPGQGGGIQGHFNGSHHGRAERFPLSLEERRELFQLQQHRVLNASPRMPDPGSPPIHHLPMLNGFSCLKCPYICGTIGTIYYHICNQHSPWVKKDGKGTIIPSFLRLFKTFSRSRIDGNWEDCQVQTYVKSQGLKYFRITPIISTLY